MASNETTTPMPPWARRLHRPQNAESKAMGREDASGALPDSPAKTVPQPAQGVWPETSSEAAPAALPDISQAGLSETSLEEISPNPAPRRPRPGVRSVRFWKKLIHDRLEIKENEHVVHGRFDPYSFFSKRRKKMDEFYSGHKIHPTQIHVNHNFARWAIEEALREYLPDSRFEVTGALMRDHSMVVGKGKREVPKEVSEAVRASGQEEIDAENANECKGSNDVDDEIVQDVGAIAQSIIAASPNSLGPPIEACASYLQMKKCGTYGRNKMTMWESPLFPTLDGKDGHKGLLDNQITAIVWIMSRFLGRLPPLKIKRKSLWDEKTQKYIQKPETQLEKETREKLRGPKYFGGILADSMGLGKTLTTIACLDILANQRLNVAKEGGQNKYRPMLILTPNATVATQWVEEIEQIAGHRGIKQILISGNGVKSKPNHERVTALSAREMGSKWPRSLKYVWDESDWKAARVIMVMSIDTWAKRTCRSEGDTEADLNWRSSFTDSKRKFSVIVVDEAYKIRNSSTKNWKSVALLDRQFTLLITATPCMNLLTDLLGPVRLLWQSPEKYLQDEKQAKKLKEIECTFSLPQDLQKLDGVNPCDDLQLVAGRPSLIAQLICRFRSSTQVDIQETRKFLKYFESLAILRRAPSSHLYLDWEKARLISLEGLLPHVDNHTVNIRLDYALEKAYQEAHIDLFMDYMESVNKWERTGGDGPVMKSIFTIHRQFQMAAASLDVYRLDRLLSMNKFSTKVEHINIMRGANVTFLRLAAFLVEQQDPEPQTALDYVKLAVRKSPILRYILHYVKENVINRKPGEKIKKLLITEASPMLAYYYELVLQFLLIHCRTLHSGLTPEQRRELIASFNDDSDESCQVMIQMYTVGFAGSNLHKSCSQVLVASQASSLAVQWQAVHRVIRVGQESDVKVYRLKVENSYHSFRESRQIDKILPELGTRAQGNMNDILVKLLNLFQFEIDELWKTKEARELMEDMDMLSELIKAQEDEGEDEGEGEPSPKRIKQEDDDTVIEPELSNREPSADPEDSGPEFDSNSNSDSDSDSDEFHDCLSEIEDEYAVSGKRKRGEEEVSSLPVQADTAKIFERDIYNFLKLQTRSKYYSEFKEFPREIKSFFCHRKNNIRRLLSFGNKHNKNATPRVWRLKDLDDSAVLERAMELMLRVRLGASNIEMLPLPHINLSLAPKEKQKKLAGLLAETKVTEQDVDNAREMVGAGLKRRGEKLSYNPIKDIIDNMSLEEIDEMLNADITNGRTEAIAAQGRIRNKRRDAKPRNNRASRWKAFKEEEDVDEDEEGGFGLEDESGDEDDANDEDGNDENWASVQSSDHLNAESTASSRHREITGMCGASKIFKGKSKPPFYS
ncbi:uncharacterized protein F4822DRAFT_442853 [Hypoxylon trugodes]|uniref:uncharacterized protein n=1 Tax=Hypoxylon trugodes TaxID=326681 RepID=UPI00219E3EB9|nr:uncharacterized protein F4822DRAFT_442853 [Hypoxylon trugodes]KAI1389617.1 hypothetical protein F4822DRAFT_442853 [Hypoxylon trugodes]